MILEHYGFTLRHWGADYIDCKTDYTGQGFDQLLYAENLIKTDQQVIESLSTTGIQVTLVNKY